MTDKKIVSLSKQEKSELLEFLKDQFGRDLEDCYDSFITCIWDDVKEIIPNDSDLFLFYNRFEKQFFLFKQEVEETIRYLENTEHSEKVLCQFM